MTDDLKAIWHELKAENKTSSGSLDPKRKEFIIDTLITATNELLQTFENERDHRQPFVSRAPCPFCDSGTVTYRYQETLIGGMICDTPECISLHL